MPESRKWVVLNKDWFLNVDNKKLRSIQFLVNILLKDKFRGFISENDRKTKNVDHKKLKSWYHHIFYGYV